MWKDEWILELTPEEKLLFVYLFSNECTSLSGLYKIAKRVIAFETGLSLDFVNKTLARFEKVGKVYYQDGLIWVVNLRRYNRGGATVYTRILSDIAAIPDCPLKRRYLAYYASETTTTDTPETPPEPEPIPYTYPTDTLSGSDVKCNEMKCNESSSGVAGEDDPLPEHPPQKASELEPSTPGGRKLFARLQANAKAKGRRGPRQFETPEQRDKFLTAEKRLPPDELDRAITAGLEAGAFERARIIAWVAKWGSGNGKYHPPDDPGLPQKIICDASRGYNQ